MISFEERGQVTVLRLDHGRASALDTELLTALADAIEALDGPAVLTGTGTIFCAGVDLFRVVDGGGDYLREFAPALTRCFRSLFQAPRPVVAAANGHAIAGGCVLVNACDHRILAAGKGRIGIPELLVGVPFPTMALEVMRHAVPARRFQEAVYSGRTWDPQAALERGLVDEVVARDEVVDRACAVAEEYAKIPAEAYALTKSNMRAPCLERVSERADREIFEVWARPETLDAIRAYLERTISGKS